MGTEFGGSQSNLDDIAEHLDLSATDATVAFVDSLAEDIARTIENTDEFEVDYLVGDVSDPGVSSNGHLHFDLVHGGVSLHCVVFGHKRREMDMELEAGVQTAVQGELSFYTEEGQISILVDHVVEIGTGLYEQTYRENRRILADDGLLDDDEKQSLPDYPQCIGIATSASSDACEDAITSIHSSYPDVDIIVRNTQVQGDDAMMDLMGAVNWLDDQPAVDVVVVTRGGGADATLRVFNETPLCRVVHRTETPVVAAIGHETDESLVGDVADRRVMTPTDIGSIVPEKAAVQDEVDRHRAALTTAMARRRTERLDKYAEQLDRAYHARTEQALATHHDDVVAGYTATTRHGLSELASRLDQSWRNLQSSQSHVAGQSLDRAYIEAVMSNVQELRSRLQSAFETHCSQTLQTCQSDLRQCYHATTSDQHRRYRTALDRRFAAIQSDRVGSLETRLDRAFRDQYRHQQHELGVLAGDLTREFHRNRDTRLQALADRLDDSYTQYRRILLEYESTLDQALHDRLLQQRHTIDRLSGDVERAFTQLTERQLQSTRRQLETAYDRYNYRVREMESDLRTAYQSLRDERRRQRHRLRTSLDREYQRCAQRQLNVYEVSLDRAYDQYQYKEEHDISAASAASQQQFRLLKGLVVVLILLVLGLVILLI